MRTLSSVVFSISLLAAPWTSAAQSADELGSPRSSAATASVATAPSRAPKTTLQYSEIDLSTVRVFALRHVDLTRIQGKRIMRDVAEPVAGHGSGFLIRENGLIATAEHVVRGRTHVAVHVFGEADARPAKVIYTDAKADLALLQTLGPARTPIALPEGPPALRIRDRVHAVGYPVDATRMDPQSSEGILSGLLPDGRLQLSIAVNPGNSGGPLVDANETLLGMIVARGAVDQGVQGIGIAVPLERILDAVALIERHEAPSRAIAELTKNRTSAQAVASTVDVLLSDVAPRALREAWNASAEDAAAPLESMGRLERLVPSATDPDLAAMLAAIFWNASLLAMESEGGHPGPGLMPQGPKRALAERALRLAIMLCHRGNDVDSSLSSRSPFVRHVLRTHPRVVRTASTK